MNKYLIIGVVVILILGGGLWYFNQSNTKIENGTSVTKNLVPTDFVFQVEDLGMDQYSRPHQRVVLQVGGSAGTKHTVGEYYMDCSIGSMGEALVPGEITRKKCWWGGTGKLIVLVSENGKYLVKIQELDSQSGNGDFKTVLEIK